MKNILFDAAQAYRCPMCRVINVNAQSVLCSSFGDEKKPGPNGAWIPGEGEEGY